MPDIITHISFNYLFNPLFRKKISLPLLLLGSTIPDILISFNMLLADILKVMDYELGSALFGFAHSITGVLFFSLILGILIRPSIKAILSLFSGGILHLFLDLFQNNWGSGNLYLFPFSFKTYTLAFFTYGVEFSYYYVLIPFFIFIILYFKEKDPLEIVITPERVSASILLLGLLAGIIIFFMPRTLTSNYYYINFRMHPELYDQKTISLNASPLISNNPPMVLFRHHILKLTAIKEKFNKNKRYDISGIYDHRKKELQVQKYQARNTWPKKIISLAGFILLGCFLFFRNNITLKFK